MPLVTLPKTAWEDVPWTSHGRCSEQGLADDSHKDTTASGKSLPLKSSSPLNATSMTPS